MLDNVSMSLKTGEIVALLGRSGSGKSTLLRIIAGLNRPTSGKVTISGRPVDGPAEEVAMVFQSFALFPWLNVLDNVEIGPRANGVPLEETRQRALKAIDTIGLDGFESAYPKELSGGMRQRVGFARALVMQPKILLMDEPFSALDVLTAETLRTDLLDLWQEGRIPIKSILMVTHNIEEAVLMSDRILVLSSNPGRIASEIPNTIPASARPARSAVPRHGRQHLRADDPAGRDRAGRAASRRRRASPSPCPTSRPTRWPACSRRSPPRPTTARRTCRISPTRSASRSTTSSPSAKRCRSSSSPTSRRRTSSSPRSASRFVDMDVDQRKKVIGEQALANVPLASHIKRVLDERPSHRAPASRFREELEDYMSEDYADRTLRTVINLGRYGELVRLRRGGPDFQLREPGIAARPRVPALV